MQQEYDVTLQRGTGSRWCYLLNEWRYKSLRALRHSLWILLLPFSLLICASQPLPQEDLNLIKRAEQTYGARAGKRVTSWRMLVMETKGRALSEEKSLSGLIIFSIGCVLLTISSCGAKRIIGQPR